MSTFRLTFSDDGVGEHKYIEFESADAGSALSILQRERRGRLVDIAQDGRILATVTRCNNAGDFWIVSPAPRLGQDSSQQSFRGAEDTMDGNDR